jgi:exopolyphosphatase/guanosine-5'-triphosphate,3'-diphosphate pyrophosphatase
VAEPATAPGGSTSAAPARGAAPLFDSEFGRDSPHAASEVVHVFRKSSANQSVCRCTLLVLLNFSPSAVAGVDLGSNSFHMIVARVDSGELQLVDRVRERVRLASGLDAKRNLSAEAMERALACLTRFGERLRELPLGAVRAAGTNTLRQAKNSGEFLERARLALGHPIEIVAGREEARLIYLGVSHSVPLEPGNRLVIDIGGGSTECILGEGFEPVATESLFMGCVSWSSRFFGKGAIDRDAFRQAETAAMLELQSFARRYRSLTWQASYGSSGTVLAIAELLEKSGWWERGITRKGLKKLRAALCDAGQLARLALPGLDPERAAVLPGGLSILMAAFKSLGIESMTPASGALREGLLYDLLGRIRHEDVRERSIKSLAARSRVDLEQASRVERTALHCLDQAAPSWGLDRGEAGKYLGWAARLHEIGLDISHTGYHKHGAYIIENADMPGFSRNEQQLLAAIVHAHRRKLQPETFTPIPADQRDFALRTSILFRIACCLNRSRSTEPLPEFELGAAKNGVRLRFPSAWLEGAPLTRADLEEDRERLQAAGLVLELAVY